MHKLAATDIDADMVCLAVMIVVKENEISGLKAAEAYFPSAVHLHICSVRKLDPVKLVVAVHAETRAIKSGRCGSAVNISASDKAADISYKA